MFIAALFTKASTWKQPSCPLTDEWIKRLWYIHTMEYYSAIRRNECESVVVRQMNLEPAIQSEVNQREKTKYCILMHIYIYTYIEIYGIHKNGTEECFYRAAIKMQTQRMDFKDTVEEAESGMN